MIQMKMSRPQITYPKAASVTLSPVLFAGLMPEAWLGGTRRFLVDVEDADGGFIMCQGIDVHSGLFSRWTKKYWFFTALSTGDATLFYLQNGSVVFLKIRRMGSRETLDIPVILQIGKTKPSLKTVPLELIARSQERTRERQRLEQQLDDYNKEIMLLYEGRRQQYDSGYDEGVYQAVRDEELLGGLREILETSEDLERTELDERYKEAIEWRGPLFRGVVGRKDGYIFTVYSNDHGKHFHVLHKQKEIDARFSFPEIELMSYKGSRNIIPSKDISRIQQYFKDPPHFGLLEAEFEKRTQN